jgi:hypothetical protein
MPISRFIQHVLHTVDGIIQEIRVSLARLHVDLAFQFWGPGLTSLAAALLSDPGPCGENTACQMFHCSV